MAPGGEEREKRSKLHAWWHNPKPIFFPRRWTHESSDAVPDQLPLTEDAVLVKMRLLHWLALGVIIGLLAGVIVAITIGTGGAVVPVIFSGMAANPAVAMTLYALLWAMAAGMAVPGLLGVLACWRDRPQIVGGKVTGRWRYWRNLILSSLCLAPIITMMAPAVGVVSGFSAFGWMATHLPMLSVPGLTVFASQMLSVGLWFAAALVGGQSVSALLMALSANREAKQQFRAAAALRFIAYFFSVGVIGGLLVLVSGLGALIAGFVKSSFPSFAEQAFSSKPLGDAFAASAAGPTLASIVVGAIVAFFAVRFGMDYVDQDEAVCQNEDAVPDGTLAGSSALDGQSAKCIIAQLPQGSPGDAPVVDASDVSAQHKKPLPVDPASTPPASTTQSHLDSTTPGLS